VVSFCEHYGTVILPTKPAMPRHKGKIEAGIKYVQANGLAGKQFTSLGAQNLHLAHWEQTVADTRIHGTTRQQVRTHFLTIEKPKLLPLPASLFPVFSEAPRKVHRDGYAEVDKAYYSVPPEYVRRGVWARWDAKIVRLFNERMEPIAVHVRQQPGKFKTDPAHIHDHKRTLIERGAEWILDRCRLLGQGAGTWAETLYRRRRWRRSILPRSSTRLADWPSHMTVGTCAICANSWPGPQHRSSSPLSTLIRLSATWKPMTIWCLAVSAWLPKTTPTLN
jgi:hypothetical protein